MSKKIKKILSSDYLRIPVLLAVLYFSQLYPYLHLHHEHGGGLFEFELSAHPIDIEVDHGSHHHHHDDEGQASEHHSKYEKYIDWHVTRAKSPNNITAVDFELRPVDSIYTEVNKRFIYNEVFPKLNQNAYRSHYLRGPPSFS